MSKKNNKKAWLKIQKQKMQIENGMKNNAPAEVIKNSLTSLLMGIFSQNMYGSTQLAQTDTLFKNMRWYLVSNQRQILNEIYCEIGAIKTIVDLPIDDAFRGGLKLHSSQLDEDQLKQLELYIEKEGIIKNIKSACKWQRLFGGGALIIITGADTTKPLDIEKEVIEGKQVYFRPCDLWELYYDVLNVEDTELEGKTVMKQPEFYNFYTNKIHKSRVIRFDGIEPPSLVRPKMRGWGLSVIESIVSSVNSYLKTNNLTFEIIDEMKVDVYKIKGFNSSLLTTNGSDKIRERIQLSNQLKNYQNAITMDTEDDYDHKQLTFSGIAEIMRELRMQLAADLRMPITKLFGISAAGFNSGEDDIENYNAMIETEIRSNVKFNIYKVLDVVCLSLFGFIPDDLEAEFESLRVMGAEQQENIKNSKLSRITQALQAGLITAKESKQAINKENLLPIKIEETDDLTPTELPINSRSSI